MLKASAFTVLFALPLVALTDPVSGFVGGPVPTKQEQAPEPKQEEKQEKPSVLDEMDEMFGSGDEAVEELVELFHEVERALVAIDDQLYEAGASGELSELDAAGLEELLRSTRGASTDVMRGIDRILEVASQMNSQQGSGSGSNQPSSSSSPLDSERDNGPMQRERTPEAPREKKQGEGSKPEPGKEEERKPDPKKDGQDPKGADGSRDRGRNKKGDPRKDASGREEPHADDSDRWGELPQRVRDTFRTQGRDELPAQYRDWIDAYYRRLSRTRT